jgi:hypothetical protein
MTLEEQREAFLTDLFVDPAVLTWDVPASASDLAKRVIDILTRFRDEPLSITFDMIESVVREPNSQIGRPEKYLAHLRNAGEIYGGMCLALLDQDDALDVPGPWEARVRGWMHDLSAMYSNYEKTGQQTKEIDLYFHAQHLGLPVLAREVAMHGSYLEILGLIFEGAPFPKSEAYEGMRTYLRKGTVYEDIKVDFASFTRGRGNFPLMTLSVADFMAIDHEAPGSDYFDQGSFEQAWSRRTLGLQERYYPRGVAPEEISAFGQALFVEGGFRRVEKYKNTIKRLLNRAKEDTAQMRVNVSGLWR